MGELTPAGPSCTTQSILDGQYFTGDTTLLGDKNLKLENQINELDKKAAGN